VPLTSRLTAAIVLIAAAAAGGCRSSAVPSDTHQQWGGLEVQVVSTAPPEEQGSRVVVLLHGYGASGDDLVPLARALDMSSTRFIVPAAPLPHPAGGRAWWPLDLAAEQQAVSEGRLDELARAVPAGLAEARAKVQALLRDVRARYRPQTLVLAGFSQGAMLAMDVALAADPPVDRVGILSGTVVAEALWQQEMSRPAKPAVFISHGREDPLLPFALSERLRDALQTHGFTVTFLAFTGGHTIPPSAVEGLRTFIH
jgi:phospholipase/carboxylesterase